MSKLWVVGCSIAHGVGVATNQRWGAVLAHQLQMDAEFLTAEGSSIEWAADQILRADIQPNDVVCWGLTTPNRTAWYDEQGRVHHILNVYYDHSPDFDHIKHRRHLVDIDLAYKSVNHVRQVQNFLTKIQCHFVIGYTLPGLKQHCQIMLQHLESTPGFTVMFDINTVNDLDAQSFLHSTHSAHRAFVDLADDGLHPGPRQHWQYAQLFLQGLDLTNK